jgi:Domain of unknown function (DUF4279)
VTSEDLTFDYGKPPLIKAFLVVWGEDLNPDEVSAKLGLQFTGTRRKGDPRPGLLPPWPDSSWEFEVRRSSFDLDKVLAELLGLAWHRREIIRALTDHPGTKASFGASITIYENCPLYVLSPLTLKRLAYFDAEFGLDIYDYSPPYETPRPHDKLVFFATDEEYLDGLEAGLRLSLIAYMYANDREVTAKAAIDALFLTWTQAERFGVTPEPEPSQARVLPMPAEYRAKGFPKYIVAGVALPPDCSVSAEEEMRIVVKAMVEAVADFNDSRPAQEIKRVATAPENLLLDRVPLAIAREILGELIPKM